MKILVACEESQAVTIEFRKLGHEAYSCDIQDCSGGYPEWHIKDDVIPLINGNCEFFTCDGVFHKLICEWDILIAFPPCTYLTVTGNKWFLPEYKKKFPTREQERKNAIEFFMKFANANCSKIAIENPVGIMSTIWKKPEQYIQPYEYGELERKKTFLWLKGLPKLYATNILEPVLYITKSGKTEPRWHIDTMKLPLKERSKMRSKTFPGIAKAMAIQWSFI